MIISNAFANVNEITKINKKTTASGPGVAA